MKLDVMSHGGQLGVIHWCGGTVVFLFWKIWSKNWKHKTCSHEAFMKLDVMSHGGLLGLSVGVSWWCNCLVSRNSRAPIFQLMGCCWCGDIYGRVEIREELGSKREALGLQLPSLWQIKLPSDDSRSIHNRADICMDSHAAHSTTYWQKLETR